MRDRLTDTQIDNAFQDLQKYFGERISRHHSVCETHSHQVTVLDHFLPDMVLFANSADDIVKAVQICNRHNLPVIAFGAGSSLEGQLNAVYGGLTIDFGKMDKVIEFHPEDMTITVEPGITREVLNSWLRDSGLFFPIDPGANASIGGMAATRASGTNAVRYGTMKDAVLCAEAVMADGRLIKTASHAKKTAAGYDLTRLLVGSEGTLGIFTSITLKLHPIPEVVSSGICTFPSVQQAAQAVIETIQCAVPVARVELLDEDAIDACNRYSNLELEVAPTLFVELHGDAALVAAQAALFGEIAAQNGGTNFAHSTNAEQRARLWKARHDFYWAGEAKYSGFHMFSTDVCVPISKLADCIVATQADMAENGLAGPIAGHVGDGNFHVLLAYRRDDPKEAQKAVDFTGRLAERAIEMGGTCTGEHGIGLRKAPYLRKELGGAVDVMAVIKQALDPKNLLNPGKYGFDKY